MEAYMSSRLMAGLDGDVIVAVQDDLGDVPVLLHVENDVRLDDARIVEVQVLDLARWHNP